MKRRGLGDNRDPTCLIVCRERSGIVNSLSPLQVHIGAHIEPDCNLSQFTPSSYLHTCVIRVSCHHSACWISRFRELLTMTLLRVAYKMLLHHESDVKGRHAERARRQTFNAAMLCGDTVTMAPPPWPGGVRPTGDSRRRLRARRHCSWVLTMPPSFERCNQQQPAADAARRGVLIGGASPVPQLRQQRRAARQKSAPLPNRHL